MGAVALADALRRRWQLGLAAAVGLLPGMGWIAHASAHLFDPTINAWIRSPESPLLAKVLQRAVGGRPYETLGFAIAALATLMIWSRLVQPEPSPHARSTAAGPEKQQSWLQVADRSGLWGGLILVVLVVAVSFFRPIAASRYFFVLVPVVMPALAASAADWALPPRAQWLALLHCWEASFAALQPKAGRFDRELDDFRSLSLRFSFAANRYVTRPNAFNVSDRVLIASGTLKEPVSP